MADGERHVFRVFGVRGSGGQLSLNRPSLGSRTSKLLGKAGAIAPETPSNFHSLKEYSPGTVVARACVLTKVLIMHVAGLCTECRRTGVVR